MVKNEQGKYALAKLLRAVANTIEYNLPSKPLILQSDPREDPCFFLVIWRNVKDRKLSEVGVHG